MEMKINTNQKLMVDDALLDKKNEDGSKYTTNVNHLQVRQALPTWKTDTTQSSSIHLALSYTK